jgi:hypothetical protein
VTEEARKAAEEGRKTEEFPLSMDKTRADIANDKARAQAAMISAQAMRDRIGMDNQFGPESDGSMTMNGVSGDEFLKTLRPDIAGQVKAYAEGRMPIPSGFALKSPYFQQMMRLVGQYDPTFDATNYPMRQKTRTDLTSGKGAEQIKNLSTVLGHLKDLRERSGKLGTTPIPAINAAINYGKTSLGSSDVTDFETNKEGVVSELVRLWRQVGGAEADLQRWSEQMRASSSPEQFKGQWQTIATMIGDRFKALENQRQQGLGDVGGRDIQVITPEARTIMDDMTAGGAAGAVPPELNGVVKPKGTIARGPNGSRFVSDGRGGWAVQ